MIPIFDATGHVSEMYGRKITKGLRKGTPNHLYLPGPHRGIFNREALKNREIILCESLIDALTFIRHGMDNATCIYGTEGFTDELFEAIKAEKIETVHLAYDADDPGERAVRRDTTKLQAVGVECYRIRFPFGQDANSYAVTEGRAALQKLVRSAEWLGSSSAPPSSPKVTSSLAANKALAASESVPSPVRAPEPQTDLPITTLAANAGNQEAAKKKSSQPELTRQGDHHTFVIGERTYQVRGLERNHTSEVLKMTLRLMEPGGFFHLDQVDLCKDQDRRRFIERASEETRLERDLIKRDLGKLLLACESTLEARLTALEQQSESAPELSPEDHQTAMAFATAPDLMNRIAQALDACGLVGERNNGLAIYLGGTSRLLPKPLACMIQSTSAAGKTTLMEAVLALFPNEEKVKYSAMTGQSLYYMADQSLQNKILAIVEEEGAEKASYALKLLQSEGELTIASTGKDPQSGRMQTEEYHVEGPAAIVLTTTSVDIDEELMNRCLVLSVDESKEQTERIQTAQREAETPEGIAAGEERTSTLTLLENFQRLLKPMKVANPFARELTFTADRTRTRRDHTKYLGLIKTIALLHQFQRDTISRSTPSGIEVEMLPITIEDIEAANQIAPEVLGRSLDDLPPQTRRLLEAIKTMASTACQQQEIPSSDYHFTRKMIRERIGWSETQTRTHLTRLEDLEYVSRIYGRQGTGCLYELLVAPNKAEGVAHIGLVDTDKLRQKHQL